jgi:hypothetical protein
MEGAGQNQSARHLPGADGRAKVELPLPVDPSRYRFLDISVEPDDGNPAHSSRSILRGRT